MKIKFISYLDLFHLVSVYFSLKSFNEIHYFDISKTCSFFLKLLRLNHKIKQFEFKLSEMRDDQGTAFFPKIYGKDLINICDVIEREIFKNDSFITAFGRMFHPEKVRLYFRKIIGRDVSDIVVFINAIAWYRQRFIDRPLNIEFSIERSLFTDILKQFALREYEIIVSSYLSLRLGLHFLYLFFGNLYLSTTVCLIAFVNSLGLFSKADKKSPEKGTRPLIASSYTLKGLTLELSHRCDFPWLLMSQIPYQHILIYFERKDVPPDPEILEQFNRKGINYLAISVMPSVTKKIPVYRPTLKVLKMIFIYTARIFYLAFKDLFFNKAGGISFLSRALSFVREFSKAYDFYEVNGIKINIDMTDLDPYRISRQLALEANGGISISYQVSNWPISNIILGSGADIMFLFGPHYYDIFLKCGTHNNTIIFNGYLSDYSFVPVREHSKRLRQNLKKNGAQFIICYFDEHSTNGRMGIIPHQRSAHVYKSLLNWVLSDRTIGLICSPKRPNSLEQTLPEIVDLMQTAKNTGRCFFYHGKYAARNYPTEPAQAADIVISLLIGGTTSLESYLSGVRAVYIDLEGLYAYPEYQWGRNKIVFDNIETLISTINAYRSDGKSYNDIGNMSLIPTIKQKDPFRDGKASVRMGQYIYWLLEIFKEGKTRDEAIKYANRNYADLWGNENVVKCH